MNKKDLILQISSRISDKIDGDTVLLLEQSIPVAIKRVTKMVSQIRPKGHERLITAQTLSGGSISQPTGVDYPRIDLTGLTNQIVIDNRLHNLDLLTTTGSVHWRGYPVEAMPVLELSQTHENLLYFIEYPYLYLGYPSGVPDVASLSVSHYTYLDIADFPEQLKDFLVEDLMTLMGLEAQKQQIENANP